MCSIDIFFGILKSDSVVIGNFLLKADIIYYLKQVAMLGFSNCSCQHAVCSGRASSCGGGELGDGAAIVVGEEAVGNSVPCRKRAAANSIYGVL